MRNLPLSTSALHPSQQNSEGTKTGLPRHWQRHSKLLHSCVFTSVLCQWPLPPGPVLPLRDSFRLHGRHTNQIEFDHMDGFIVSSWILIYPERQISYSLQISLPQFASTWSFFYSNQSSTASHVFCCSCSHQNFHISTYIIAILSWLKRNQITSNKTLNYGASARLTWPCIDPAVKQFKSLFISCHH
jgi:hypothetical protein